MALIEESLTSQILRGALEVHRALGPGLLESIYEDCLELELRRSGLKVERQVAVPIRYRGIRAGHDLKIDLLVDERIVVEVKAIERLLSVHEAQLRTYLRMSGRRVGLLLNFNVALLKDGIIRRVL